MAKAGNDTPLMQQHRAIKQKYPDAVLLFRVGDFYETFGEDAIVAAQVLGITLTKRNNGAAAASELAGFPYHALDNYLHKLVKAGYRVAVCDQLEDPKQVKGIVKRGVTEMLTPGLALNDKLLEQNKNNFLAAYFTLEGTRGEKQVGLAFLDASTGEMLLAQGSVDYADQVLARLLPAEIILPKNEAKAFKERTGQAWYTYALDPWVFGEAYAAEQLQKQFQTHSLKGFGIDHWPAATIAAGAILHYLKETEHPHLAHINRLQRLDEQAYLWMDRFTLRNLELFPSAQGGPGSTSLLQVMDHTLTPMGGRLLRRWMAFPLQDLTAIAARTQAVTALLMDQDARFQLRQQLRACGDVERLVSKVPMRKINPREVLQLARTLETIEAILGEASLPALSPWISALDPLPTWQKTIRETLDDEPALALNKGKVIRAGVDSALDEYRHVATGAKEILQDIQEREAKATGISSLKISFNNVFGYYLEVTHAHKEKVPPEWIRKQTLTNAERYITQELKNFEEKILGAEEKILALETQLYQALVESLQPCIAALQTNAVALAALDVLACFAELAFKNNYAPAELHTGDDLDIKAGRHPVIEKNLGPDKLYIDNDLFLDRDTQQVIILTGPNMSGKSALLRQTALITLMAHMGSYVPATQARIPLTDKIFTRVGANDNLSGGESTFMVEMNETASILNNLSEKSLVILDEIGRGTATFDGISIAWSMVEFLQQSPEKPKTLFATHYHELNALEERLTGVRNYHITHQESNNNVVFLRKLALGGSTHSFGIQVAQMAGMPAKLVARARQVLTQLEKEQVDPQQVGESLPQKLNSLPQHQVQLSIFDAHTSTFQAMREQLEAIDINALTPVEALLRLNEIKKLLQ